MKKISIFMITLLAFTAHAQKQPKKPAQQPTQTSQPTQPSQPATTSTQPNTQPPINPLTEHFAKKNALATRWNDLDQAKDALYDLIAENPGNDSLIYVLSVYYFENRQYVSAVLVAQDLLTNNPKNINLLQLAATCYEALGIKEKALTHYESVYLINSSTAVLYKMSILQYDLKKFAESKTNADILMTKRDLDSLKVTMNDVQNKQKEYPLKASILNIQGLLALQANDKPAAKKAFEAALAVSPDFPLAKENLAKLK